MNHLSPRAIKIVAVVSGVLFVILVIIGIVQAIYLKTYSSVLKIIDTPLSSTIQIDNETVNGDEHRVRPGNHTIYVFKDGFKSQEQNITIGDGETKNVYFILEPNETSTMNWYEEHEEDGKIREWISGEKLIESSENIQRNYPAVSFLPYSTSAYSIGYGACDDNPSEVCMKFTSERASGIWSVALKRFAQLDKELGKYNYEFIGYNNPVDVLDETSSLERLEDAAMKIVNCSDGECTIKETKRIGKYYVVYLNYAGNSYPVNSDIYRMIFEENEGWNLVVSPRLVIAYEDFPDIQKDVIDEVNATF